MLDLSQKLYIEKVLNRFSMKNSKKRLSPLKHGIHLSKMMCLTTSRKIQRMSRIPYASTIGSLIYVMLCTRPDVVLTVSVMSRYQSNPSEEHWIAVKNIFKYLRRTKYLFLIFGGDFELQVEEYTDLDFIFDSDDRKSTSGYMFICNGDVVS